MTSAFPSRPARHFLQHIMRLVALTLAFALLAAFSFDAGAARLGGGRSAGRQSSQVTQREAARQQPAVPGQQQAGQQPRRQWGGLLGGLAAGLGLAWLANALGLGEGFANVLLIALLVMAARQRSPGRRRPRLASGQLLQPGQGRQRCQRPPVGARGHDRRRLHDRLGPFRPARLGHSCRL